MEMGEYSKIFPLKKSHDFGGYGDGFFPSMKMNLPFPFLAASGGSGGGYKAEDFQDLVCLWPKKRHHP